MREIWKYVPFPKGNIYTLSPTSNVMDPLAWGFAVSNLIETQHHNQGIHLIESPVHDHTNAIFLASKMSPALNWRGYLHVPPGCGNPVLSSIHLHLSPWSRGQLAASSRTERTRGTVFIIQDAISNSPPLQPFHNNLVLPITSIPVDHYNCWQLFRPISYFIPT